MHPASLTHLLTGASGQGARTPGAERQADGAGAGASEDSAWRQRNEVVVACAFVDPSDRNRPERRRRVRQDAAAAAGADADDAVAGVEIDVDTHPDAGPGVVPIVAEAAVASEATSAADATSVTDAHATHDDASDFERNNAPLDAQRLGTAPSFGGLMGRGAAPQVALDADDEWQRTAIAAARAVWAITATAEQVAMLTNLHPSQEELGRVVSTPSLPQPAGARGPSAGARRGPWTETTLTVPTGPLPWPDSGPGPDEGTDTPRMGRRNAISLPLPRATSAPASAGGRRRSRGHGAS